MQFVHFLLVSVCQKTIIKQSLYSRDDHGTNILLNNDAYERLEMLLVG